MKTTTNGIAAVLAAALLSLTAPAASHGDWRPDAWITAKAKIALATTDNASALDVNVDTVNGKITLHGKVPTEVAKTAAESAVSDIDGVTGVRNLLQVVPSGKQESVTRADEQIRTDVAQTLTDHPQLDGSDIEVQSVHDGVVLLAGEADSLTDHLAAIRIAAAVPGVRRVASEVTTDDRVQVDDELSRYAERVQDGAGEAAAGAKRGAEKAWKETKEGAATAWKETKEGAGEAAGKTSSVLRDAWITTATKTRLLADPDAPALSINVDTRDGIVTLFGTVPSQAAMKAAEANARQVSGVKSVRNELRIVEPEESDATAAVDDGEIKSRVERALNEREPLRHADIDIAVDDGTVHLTGSVPNEALRQSAGTISRSIAGVRSVTNDLRVRPVDERADAGVF